MKIIKPEIIQINEMKLVGIYTKMNHTNDKTLQLWKTFMSKRHEILYPLSKDLISMKVYESTDYFLQYHPETLFNKWAAVEVANMNQIPEGMEFYTIPEGLYAVFLYRGASNSGHLIFNYIFMSWLPASGYAIDDRPHFEILGEKYKNNDPDSEETIWIPIRKVAFVI